MRGSDRIHIGLAILLLGGAVCLRGLAQPAATPDQPCTNQSPRVLANYNVDPGLATVHHGINDNTLVYTPQGGSPMILHRCSQHYHCRIENLQPDCPGQMATEIGTPPLCAQPSLDSWVEIHTVYAAKVRGQGCDPESLNCCAAGPFVVKAYHARVEANPQAKAQATTVSVLWDLPAAEWSGSNTGPDDYPGGCKPLAARWSFTLGCTFRVTWGQLKGFHHPEPARGLQPANRLSTDLAKIPKP
jgi:hypothetical protein